MGIVWRAFDDTPLQDDLDDLMESYVKANLLEPEKLPLWPYLQEKHKFNQEHDPIPPYTATNPFIWPYLPSKDELASLTEDGESRFNIIHGFLWGRHV